MNTYMYPDLFYPANSARSSSSSFAKFNSVDTKKLNPYSKIKPLSSAEIQRLNIDILKKDGNHKDLFWVSARERTRFMKMRLKAAENLPKIESNISLNNNNNNNNTPNQNKKFLSNESLSKMSKASNIAESNANTAAVLVDLNRQSLETFAPINGDSNKTRYFTKYLYNKKSYPLSSSTIPKSNTVMESNRSIISPASPLSVTSTHITDSTDRRSIHSNIDKIEGCKIQIEELSSRRHNQKQEQVSFRSSLFKMRDEDHQYVNDIKTNEQITNYRLKPLNNSNQNHLDNDKIHTSRTKRSDSTRISQNRSTQKINWDKHDNSEDNFYYEKENSTENFAEIPVTRVESPHKLRKSMPDGYKFVSHSSMNLKNRQFKSQFELFQSNFYDSDLRN